MPLHRVIKTYRNGTKTDEISYGESTNHSYIHENSVLSSVVQLFKYDVPVSVIPPTIARVNGKTVILPSWIECHPLTTLKDINWTPPQPVQDKVKETFESKSGLGEYKTSYNPNNNTYKCNCFGFYRAKDRQCKHIKALKEKMSNV